MKRYIVQVVVWEIETDGKGEETWEVAEQKDLGCETEDQDHALVFAEKFTNGRN